MKLSKNQRGTGVIELLLLLVIVGAVGFTGWYVWNSKKSSDDALSNSGKGDAAQIDKKTTNSNDETASWLQYQPPGKEYSVRLADGWKLERYQQSSSIYTFSNDLDLKTGTKAVVKQVEGGKDGAGGGFGLNFATVKASDNPLGDVMGTFQTKDGETFTVYKYVEQEDTAEGMGALGKGGVQYTYLAQAKGQQKYVVSWYGIPAGERDDAAVVQKVLSTLHFN